jgi:hypothetical protein
MHRIHRRSFERKPGSRENAICHAPKLLPQQSCDTLVVAELNLNAHQLMRAEIVTLRGRAVVRLARWKLTTAGPRRTGQAFEFGIHRIADIAGMISEVQRHLGLDGGAK